MFSYSKCCYLLFISVGPRFVRIPNDIELGSTDRLELVCDVQGYPSPTITWYINDTETISKLLV